MSTLIVGCGYLGERVGKCLVERGERVFGTVRSAARAGQLDHLGIEPLIADVVQPESLDALPSVKRILYCVGFDRSAGIDRRAVSIVGLKNFLDRAPRAVRRIVYASSTSVYGQTQGSGSPKIHRPTRLRNLARFARKLKKPFEAGESELGVRKSCFDSQVFTALAG